MRLRNLSPSGLVVAVLGFVLTRSTVTLTVTGGVREFVFAGLVPLLLGLSLAVLGVALAVGSFEPWYVKTSAVWCCIGFLSMAALVGLTVVGTGADIFSAIRSDPTVSNVLIGGSVGGTLTGMYAARTRRERHASRNRANRLVVLNRILREEVINAVTVIKARAQLVDGENGADDTDTAETIAEYADRITDTIENVEYLTKTADNGGTALGQVDIDRVVASGVETARQRHPAATVRIEGAEGMYVHANDRLEHALCQLVENAIVHNDVDQPTVTVRVDATPTGEVRLSVADDGPGLPERQQRVLETGEIAEHDDPHAGFGLNVVRLLVESYRGRVETDVGPEGTTVTLVLPQADAAATAVPDIANVRSYGVDSTRLVAAGGASLVAGAVMGAVFHAMAGIVPVIGALYGSSSIVVGVITHEFHSVVFGLMYAAFLGVAPEWLRADARGHVLVGLAWAGFLWLFAAGFIMAAWLRLVGIDAPLPNITLASFVAHAVWGATLGSVYYVLTDSVPSDAVSGWLARLDWS